MMLSCHDTTYESVPGFPSPFFFFCWDEARTWEQGYPSVTPEQLTKSGDGRNAQWVIFCMAPRSAFLTRGRCVVVVACAAYLQLTVGQNFGGWAIQTSS